MSQLSSIVSMQAQTNFSPQQLQQQILVMQDTLVSLMQRIQEPILRSSYGSNPLNPYSVPELLWRNNSESSGPKSGSLFSPQKSISSATSESITTSSGTESSEDSISQSSESESIPLGTMVIQHSIANSSSLESENESSEEENIPLARQSVLLESQRQSLGIRPPNNQRQSFGIRPPSSQPSRPTSQFIQSPQIPVQNFATEPLKIPSTQYQAPQIPAQSSTNVLVKNVKKGGIWTIRPAIL